ncbi:MAG TPA: ABC transporter permease [Gemmatimonadaceae bacterium]|nr:ABC transporter permease [Gemmatimonadaceae bacterium]
MRRVADSILLLWLVLTLTFLLLRAAPGDPSALLIPPSASAADVARIRARLGLNAPLPVQYARWAGGVLKGDLGESFVYQRPVWSVLRQTLPVSLGLGIASLLLTFLIGVAVGTYQAVHRGRAADTVLTVATTAVYAAPSFWLALALVAVFTYGAARWGFPVALRLPAFGLHDPAGQLSGLAAVGDVVRHAILPVATLAAIGAAGIARYSRSAVADLLGTQFVRTARAKGVPRPTLYVRHVIRNALPPLVILFALSLPGVLAGSVFVETVFAWPGMGHLLVTSILSRDYPVVMGATVLYAAMVIAANLAADLALPFLDPARRG